ncbi:MAG: ABC transporter permease, partial [Ignavibacteria bacterium]|nr:ABC transporter permease [Ignavibacteria bacterium]
MNFHRTYTIAKKEFKHLLRDFRMLYVLLSFPVFLLVMFGYVVNFDVHHIKISVYDQDKTNESRNFIEAIVSSEYFDLSGYISSDSQIKETLDNKLAQCVIIIPKDFSRKIYSRQEVKVQVLIDGVNGNTATITQNYINSALRKLNQDILLTMSAKAGISFYSPLDIQFRFWFNPDLQSSRFLIPGLISMILLITAAVSVSLSLVREKELGTIEQVHVSPIKTIELLTGKSLPYVSLAFLNSFLILFASHVVFGVEVKGNLLLLFLSIFIFLVAATSIGILVSAISDSQQIAFTLATVITLLPSFILSGFVFPIESMPW